MVPEPMTRSCGIFLVASNPVDLLTYAVWKASGLPRERYLEQQEAVRASEEASAVDLPPLARSEAGCEIVAQGGPPTKRNV